jgi:hypothetical protein
MASWPFGFAAPTPSDFKALTAAQTALPLTPPLSTTHGGGGASSTLLPAAHLTPSPLLGHTHEERSTLAQLLATQVGHILIERGGAGGPPAGAGGLPGTDGAAGGGGGGAGVGGMLVMGVGLRNETIDREEFAALVGGVLDCVG